MRQLKDYADVIKEPFPLYLCLFKLSIQLLSFLCSSLVSLLITVQNLERTVNLSGVAFIAALLPSHYTVIIVAGAGL